MRVGARTTLVLLAVAVVPVAIAGWTTRSLSRDALIERAEDRAQQSARVLATRVVDAMSTRLNAVELAAAAIDLDALVAEDRVWALRLIFRQVPDASAVALIDAEGEAVGPPVFLADKAEDPKLAGRPVLRDGDLERFGTGIPHTLAREVGRAFGVPYVSTSGAPRIVIAVRATTRFTLAVEVALDPLLEVLAEHDLGDAGRALVVDDQGRVILSSQAAGTGTTDVERLQAAAGDEAVGRYRDGQGREQLGALVAVRDLPWRVLVAEPLDDALAIARAVTTRMIVWVAVALVGALILGVLSSRALVQPIERLAAGASAIKAGKIDHRVEGEERGDELGDLARAFNGMADEVERWRHELESKVEERTRELRESQELLARAQKIAAVGQLGAGVAHEINNPLFALAGMAELMQADEEEGGKRFKNLGMIRDQAARIEEIVARLLALADQTEGSELAEADVLSSARAALERVREHTAETGVVVAAELGDVPPVRASADELREVIGELLDNACDAVGEDGKIELEVSEVDGQMVRIRVSDDGPGIGRDLQHRVFDPFFTKSARSGARGLGLSRAQQIVSAQGGKILLDSEPGEGTTFTVLLPAAQKRSRA